ncbi:hypothetical protein [Caballeronia sp. S22]|uniref:hypothetical protein n=1 Tax=Caballeronia sp. S22 TaxID=3137182 RepID=UPI003530EDB7
MSDLEEDGGIVKHYVGMFCQLGVKSESGEDVSRRVSILVENAVKHIDIWQSGEPTNNKAKLVAQLRIRAQMLAREAPAQSKVLKDAAGLLEDF